MTPFAFPAALFSLLLQQLPNLFPGLIPGLTPPSPLATFSDQTYMYHHLNSTFPDNIHFLFFPVSWVNKPAGAEG